MNALPRPHWWIVCLSLTPLPGTPLHARCVKDRSLAKWFRTVKKRHHVAARPDAVVVCGDVPDPASVHRARPRPRRHESDRLILLRQALAVAENGLERRKPPHNRLLHPISRCSAKKIERPGNQDHASICAMA